MPRVLCAVLMVCLLSGCSSKGLSEKTVKQEMQSRLHKQVAFGWVPLGRISSHCKREFVPGELDNNDLSPDRWVTTRVAEMAGYVTVTPDGQDYWRTSVTDQGKKAPHEENILNDPFQSNLNGCDFKMSPFVVAYAEFGRVLDIQRAQDAWNVTFTWRWAPTELGKSLEKDGAIYSKLTPAQTERVARVFGGTGLEPKFPISLDETTMKAQFKMGSDGVWNVGSNE